MTSKKLLLLGYVWPEPESSAAGVRTLHVLKAFKQAGYSVSFSTASKNQASPGGSKRDPEAQLKSLGIETFQFAVNDSSFDPWISELSPEVVIFDRFVTEEQFGWRVREFSPSSVRIVDTQDFHYLRKARQRSLVVTPENGSDVDPDLLRELASLYRSDQSWFVSSHETDFIHSEYGVPRELLLTTPLSVNHLKDSLTGTPSFEERKDCVFLGNFRHPPNHDAMEWLLTELWPKVQSEFKSHGVSPVPGLVLAGAYPSSKIAELSKKIEGVKIEGWVEDQVAFLSQFRVSLAPLRFGAGIKGKILESFASGTPVWTTEIGSEGIDPSIGFPLERAMNAETQKDWIKALVALYSDLGAWQSNREKAFSILSKSHDPRINGPVMVAAADRLIEQRALGLNQDRNWVREILWHQSLRSTEYFSRWIELKNRLKSENGF